MTPAPPSSSAPFAIPVWLDRLAAVGWRILAISALGVVLALLAIQLAIVTAAVILSLIVAAPFVPTIARLRGRGLSRSVASAAACAVALVAVLVILVLLVAAFLPYLRDIFKLVTEGAQDISGWLASIGVPPWVVTALDAVIRTIHESSDRVDLASLVGDAVDVGTVLVLAGFLLFFMLQDGDRGWAWLTNQVQPWQARTLTASAIEGTDRVGDFVSRTVTLAALDAIVAFVVLTLLGVPLTGPMVAVVFLGGFVPYLGGIVATALVGLATLALAGSGAAVALVAVLAAASVVESRALAGTSIGRRGDVHPALVLLAIPAGAALLGVFGVVTIIPVTLFILTMVRPIISTLDIGPAVEAATRRRSWAIPAWLDRLAQLSWRGLVCVGLAFLGISVIVAVPVLVVPVVLAIVIAATLLPILNRLLRSGMTRGVAAMATTLGATLAIVLALAVTIIWTLTPMQEVLDTATVGANHIDTGWLTSAAGQISSAVSISMLGVVRGVIGIGLALVLLVLLTFFFLRDGGTFWDAATDRIRGARRDHLDEAGERAVAVLSGYMVGTALISLFGAVTSALIMLILGLPLALPIGILTFFGGFIPYIGSFVTTAMAFLVAVAVGSTADIVIMFVYTIVFNLIQGSFVAPIVYGRALSLHPAIVLVAVPVGGAIAGILGMFLVVPIVAIVSATWRLVVATIEDDNPAGAPEPSDVAADAALSGEAAPAGT